MYTLDPDKLNIQWKYKSGNGVVAICENPEHDDKNPSMYVDLEKEFCYCFSCGFSATVNELIDITEGYKKWGYSKKLHNDLIDNEWKQFLNNPIAFDDIFLVKRGFTNNTIEQFGIRHTEDKIIIPIKNNKDEIVAIKVRLKKPNGGVKYLTFGKQPDYVTNNKFLISQSSEPLKKRVWVTEGMFGLMRLTQEGYTALTPLSSNRLSGLYSLMNLTPYNQYMIMFDPDFSGYTSVMKFLYDCRGLDNVFSFNQFQDVDSLSENAIGELMFSDKSKSCTQYHNDLLRKISKEFEFDLFYKAQGVLLKHIERKIK